MKSKTNMKPLEVRPPSLVIWLTGLSGSGKSTIAVLVVEELRRRGQAVEHLDGDTIRQMFPSTGFSREARDEHVRRVGYTAVLLAKHGVFVVVSLVSPYRDSREFVREHAPTFLEVHVSTPLAECERRDVKGLYAKARRGEIRQFTGIDDPYEPPTHPELTINTLDCSAREAAEMIVRAAEAACRPSAEESQS
jgi:adenylylsulfate kinase